MPFSLHPCDVDYRSKLLAQITGVNLLALMGKTIGMESFGESAPGDVLLNYFGFTTNNIIKTIHSMV